MENLNYINIHNLSVTEDSVSLLKYYSNIINKNNKNLFLSDILDTKTDYYKLHKFIYENLNYIYRKLKEYFIDNNSLINLDDYREIISSNNINYTKIVSSIYYKHLKDSKFISNEIKNYIYKKPVNSSDINSFILKYDLLYENQNINIYFIIYIQEEYYFNNIKKMLNKYDKYVFHMLAVINLLIKLTNNNCSKKELNIYIFNTPFKRTLNNGIKKSTIGPKNINGGFCYGCTDIGNIIIYRREEFFKVLCHELCHNYGVDKYIFEFINNSLYKKKKSNLYNKFINNFNLSKKINREKYDIGLQESLIEFWGIFLNTSIFVFNTSQTYNIIYYNKLNYYIDFFDQLFKYEIVHTFFQTEKILKYNNLEINSLLSDTNIKKNNLNNYNETTHVFSYIILKLFLLINYKEFINSHISIKKQVTNNILKYKIIFHPSLKNINNFFNYIINIRNSNAEYIKKNINYFKILLNKTNNKLLINNSRLSCVEIL